MLSATNFASRSGFLTSLTLITRFFVGLMIFESCFLITSILAPFCPIRTAGLPVKRLITSLSFVLSIPTLLIAAWAYDFAKKFLIFLSSRRNLAKSS